MKKSVLLFSLLSGTALMLPNLAIASGSHTYTLTHSLKPELSFEFAKLDNTLKIASVCFLGYGNCGDGDFSSGDDDYTLDTVKQCKNEGYVNSCASGYCLDHSCPYNASYGTCLVDNCPSNSSTSCTGSVVSQNNCGEDCKKCCDEAQNLTPVVLPAEPNAVQPVITVTLLAPPAPVHLIPEHLLEPTNADRPVRNVIMLVLRDIQHLQQLNATIQSPMNAALLVIKKKTAILVPVIMNAAEHGNIAKVQPARQILQNVVYIAKTTTFHILAEATMVHVTGIIETVIAPCLVIKLKQILAKA